MSTSAPAVAHRRTVSAPAWIGIALAFAIGAAGGAVAATVIADQPTAAPAAEVAAAPAQIATPGSKADAAMSRGDIRLSLQFLSQELTGAQADLNDLIAKADAAASRGDVRLFLQYRDDLAAYIGSVDITTFQDLREHGLEAE